MGTLSALMHSSLSALQADQAALDVTSKNVANQNTVGYTREVVQWQTGDSVSLSSGAEGSVTLGNGPVSQRDRVLEQRVQQQTQSKTQSAAMESTLQQVQNIFSLSSAAGSAGTTVLGSATDIFFNSLSALANNSADTSTRQSVLAAANGLAAAFNSAAKQLSQIGAGLDQRVGLIVGQVNVLTAKVADLNSKVTVLPPGVDGGQLEDQRQAAIAELSQYVGLNQIATEHNGIALTTTGGQVLVGRNTAYALATTQVNGTTHVIAGGTQDITAAISGGELGGVIAARDTALPGYSGKLDALATAIATNVNQANSQGLDEYGNNGASLFGGLYGSGGAATIVVTTGDPKRIAAAASGEGSAGNTNALVLADLSSANLVGGTTAGMFYASFLNEVGNDTAAASADTVTQQTTLTQLTTQRDSLSGVSLDQEAANLTQYQRSYEAAARVFSIVNTLMASAINLGQGTTVG
jgi:flagellar hook-associated protein 1 FlgK